MSDIRARLLSWCIDWNGAPMVDGEQPRVIPRVRDLRDAADEIGRMTELAYAPDGKEHRSMVFEEAAKRLPLQEEIERLRKALFEIEGWTGEHVTRNMARAALTAGDHGNG